MKKIIAIALIVAGVLAVLLFLKYVIQIRRVSPIRSGAQTEDFILGMKDYNTYRLSSLTGKYSIVLSFLDASTRSDRVKKITNTAVYTFFYGKDVLWFNITKDGAYAVIEEKTGNFPLNYKTLYSNIPAFYSFSAYPSFIVSDRYGIITLLYIGYSPTFLRDITRETKRLPGKKK